MKAESEERVTKPKRRRWWWLWAALPWVVALGILAVHWYDTTPVSYRVVARVVEASHGSGCCAQNGLLAEEEKGTFVFRDLEGREQWRVEVPTADFSLWTAYPIEDLLSNTPGGYPCVSLDGHVCAFATPEGSGWTVHSWRDGKLIGAAHASIGKNEWDGFISCADDDSVFFSVGGDGSNPPLYLIHGDHMVAQGLTGFMGPISPDGSTLIAMAGRTISSGCHYGKVMIKGQALSVDWSAETRYDGRYGQLFGARTGTYLPSGGRGGMFGPEAPPCWQGETEFGRLAVKPKWTATPVAGTPMTVKTTATATVYHPDTKAGWSVALPRDTTTVDAMDDDRHLLAGHGMAMMTADPWLWFRKWPVVGRFAPEPSPRIEMSLYNRDGKCEATLPYSQLMDLCGKVNPMGGGKWFEVSILATSADGTRLVLGDTTPEVFFLRADPHPTVWRTITGWFQRKG